MDRCGVVWCGVVWCGVVWCSMISIPPHLGDGVGPGVGDGVGLHTHPSHPQVPHSIASKKPTISSQRKRCLMRAYLVVGGSVGEGVGVDVGAGVGVSVGEWVGVGEGDGVGELVGLNVGSAW